MDEWNGWPHERLIYAFLTVAWLAVWAQVTLLHWRGGFRSKFMWGPVIYTPILALAALVLTFTRATWAQYFFIGTHALGVLEGLLGTYKHIGGVTSHVGGFNLRNMIAGPPWILPVIYTAVAAFGLLALYWYSMTGASGAGY
jgi:hypothetical protein